MGITMFTSGGLLAPLRTLMGSLAHAPRARRSASPGPQPDQSAFAQGSSSWPAFAVGSRDRPLRRPLRVVRVVDGAHAPAAAGRMFISGRMAEVCAELDRLAALETAAG